MTPDRSPTGPHSVASEAALALARARWDHDTRGLDRHFRNVVRRIGALTPDQRRQLREALNRVGNVA